MSTATPLHRLLPCCAAAAVALSACSSAAPSAGGIDLAVREQLRQDLSTLATAVAGHHQQAARSALGGLDADANAAHAAGRLSDGRYAAIRTAARQLAADLVPAPTSSVTATTAVTPPPTHTTHPAKPPKPRPKPKPKPGKGKKHGGGED